MVNRCGHTTRSGRPCKIRVPEQGQRCFVHAQGREECSICQENIHSACKTLPCGHEFHRKCILDWKNRGHHTCPMCRQSFCDPPQKYRITVTIQNLQRNVTRTFDIQRIPQFIIDMNIVDEDAYVTEAFIDVATEDALRVVLNDLQISDINDII